VYIVHTYKGGRCLNLPPGYLIKLMKENNIMSNATVALANNTALIGFTITKEEGKCTFTLGNTAFVCGWSNGVSMMTVARHNEIIFSTGRVQAWCVEGYYTVKQRCALLVKWFKNMITSIWNGMCSGKQAASNMWSTLAGDIKADAAKAKAVREAARPVAPTHVDIVAPVAPCDVVLTQAPVVAPVQAEVVIEAADIEVVAEVVEATIEEQVAAAMPELTAYELKTIELKKAVTTAPSNNKAKAAKKALAAHLKSA
jgi:hypothetical protein